MTDVGPIARGHLTSSSIDMSPDEPETTIFLVTELTGLIGETEVIEMTDAASGPLQRISIATFPGRKLLLQLNL